ncbi:MAG TPA: hypothetical protein VL242_37320 [Sorangium sp.]|nr:hypothetical protein [Sorangium sp.]
MTHPRFQAKPLRDPVDALLRCWVEAAADMDPFHPGSGPSRSR